MFKLITALLTVLAGVGAALALYWVLNKIAELLPGNTEHRVKPYLYVLPAFAAIAVYLLYPAVATVIASFKDAQGAAFVGFDNYTDLFDDKGFVSVTLLNSLLWVLIVPAVTVVLGLAVAVLADRLSAQAEKLTKTIIFMPMAISAIGAADGVELHLRVAGHAVGLQNAVVGLVGFGPVAWLEQSGFRFNSLLLMVVLMWGQVGFSMVLLSSAIKGVPVDTLEAARIDGAERAGDLLPGRGPADQGHHHHGLHHRHHRRHEGLRHRLRDDERRLQDQRARQRVLEPAQHLLQQREGLGHRRAADARGAADPGLPSPPLPRRGGKRMTHRNRGRTDERRPAQAKQRKKAASFDPNPAKAGWLTKLVLAIICFLWLTPIIGTFLTSLRPLKDAENTGWWTLFSGEGIGQPDASTTTPRRSIGANMGNAFVNSLAIALPATFIPILVASFAAYAFTFMEFPGRDVMFLVIVSLLVVPNFVAFVPLLKIYGNLELNGTFPAVWLAHIGFGMSLGGLHPAQLHGHAAQDGHRVGQDRRRLALPDVLPAGAADVGAGAGVVRDPAVPVGVERPAGGAGLHRSGRQRADHRRPDAPARASSARAGT